MDGAEYNPASSTNSRCGLEPSRPLYPSKYAGYSDSPFDYHSFSLGLERASKCRESVYSRRESVTCPVELTNGIGTRECHYFRKKIFDRIAPIAFDAAHQYIKITKEYDHAAANRYLSQLHRNLKIGDLNLAEDVADLKRFAQKKAYECLRNTTSLSNKLAVNYCIAKLGDYGLSLPDDFSYAEVLHYARDEKFWFRKVKQLAFQKME